MPVMAGAGLLAGALMEALILYFLLQMLQDTGSVRENYQGTLIPVSAGLSFPMAVLVVFLIYRILSWYDPAYHLFLLGIITISLLGFVDDMLGQRDTLGFKGHFSALFKGKLTTGGLKAVGGGMTALFLACFGEPGWGNLVVNTLVISLSTNMMNLLDLRPGRAIKGFIFFLAVIIVAARLQIDWVLIVPLLGAVVYYLGFDLKSRAMMGDAGANVLGLSLGYLCTITFPLITRVGILVFLIGVHVFTEKYSLTKTIEKVPLLHAIDRLGRN